MIRSQASSIPATRAGLPISSISVVIPAYNDAPTVARLIDDTDCLLNEICTDYEILCINDGSHDNTLTVLEERLMRMKNLRVINHPINHGYGRTIKELYMKGSKDLIFSLPGDYQFAPKELLTMVHGLKAHDFVIGWRVHRNDPPRRKIQSMIYNLMLRIFHGVSFKDVNSIKLFKREILEHITLKSETAFVDAELCIRAHKAGFNLVEIPIQHLPRTTPGASGGKISVIARTFADLIFLSRDI